MGPSGSAFRSRSQTSPSCRGKEAWWWEMKGEMKGQHTSVSEIDFKDCTETVHGEDHSRRMGW